MALSKAMMALAKGNGRILSMKYSPNFEMEGGCRINFSRVSTEMFLSEGVGQGPHSETYLVEKKKSTRPAWHSIS